MAKIDSHPSVIAVRRRSRTAETQRPPAVLDAEWLRKLCFDAGADDAGFVEMERPELAEERAQIERAFHGPRALISFVCKMNRENVRSPARRASNLEFHLTNPDTNEGGRGLAAGGGWGGVGAFNGNGGFPRGVDRSPAERIWVVAHKPIAIAA